MLNCWEIFDPQPLIQSQKYICLNGKKPNKLSKKQILKEFAAGPCSPIVIVPATIATRLLIQIDCEVLRIEHPEIFSLCGWNACQKRFFEFWKRVPKPEYKLWITSLFSPMSMFKFSDKKNFCFAKFMKLTVDFTKPVEDAVIEQKGFKVKIYGSTSESHKKFECGDKSISYLLGNKWLESKATRSFGPIIKMLRQMGYVAGLTYQSLPYDFRLSIRANQLKKSFKSNIQRLNYLTKKKVLIIGHSFGNNNIYHQLLKLDSEFKKNTIKLWLGLGSPILGDNKTMEGIIAGDNSFLYFHSLFGLHFGAEVEAINNLLSIYELLPINTFKKFADTNWMQAIIKRMEYEKGNIPYEQSELLFLPKTTENCSPANFKAFATSCRFGFTDQNKNYVIKILDEEFKDYEMESLFRKYNVTEHTLEFYKYTAKTRETDFRHPGVPYVPIVLRTHQTPYQYYFDDDIRKYTDHHKFIEPKKIKGYGDGTVNTNSMLIPALKWALEYDQGLPGTAPVKIIDLCSTYNLKKDVYDVKEPGKPYEIVNNEFIGIECDCIKHKTPNSCNHSLMTQDSKVMELLYTSLIDNNFTYTDELDRFINNLDDDYLREITEDCPQVIFNERRVNDNKLRTFEIDI